MMHAVIGTAGHVDHGKSSLIEALTGINPSHLPQEFARGMTIDLGFAYFTSPQGDKIGVIDVPGHERFIRNMVSSIWGLDMVLFVVAADAGWAALSEEHLRVIAAMGVKHILVVITKCDLVDEKRLAAVENEALERFIALADMLPEVLYTSVQTGQGISELKQRIETLATQIEVRGNLDQDAHLYVDRVFSINGVGTTVTGTLRGAALTEGEVLTLYPGAQTVRIKSLQSYHEPLDRVEPYSRVAIGLKQVNRKTVGRGSCLVANSSAVTMSKDWIVQLNPKFSEMKKQSELEVALGTAHVQANCFVFADGQLARLQLKEAVPAFWGQPLVLIQHGGSRIIGSGRLVWLQTLEKGLRQALLEALPTLEVNPNDSSAKVGLQLALKGYTPLTQACDAPEGVQVLGLWWISNSCLHRLVQICGQILIDSIHAVSVDQLARQTEHPISLIDALVTSECQAGHWQRIEGGVISLQAREDGKLPADQAHLLEQIELAGKQGYDTLKTQQPGIQRLLRSLTERNLIVPTVDKIFFTRAVYDELVRKIISARTLGEQFDVANARERTQLARKQLIPLLNRMERDGWVRRVGDNRVVCKLHSGNQSEKPKIT